ncbi:MAG: hypothetical protein WCC25_19165, partial [Candidatus Korobacteraceae bacterium]
LHRLLKKSFSWHFEAKIRPQVIESSFPGTLEITSLVPFSAACSADDRAHARQSFSAAFFQSRRTAARRPGL